MVFFKRVLDTEILLQYNWDGKAAKKELKMLKLISGVLKGIYRVIFLFK